MAAKTGSKNLIDPTFRNCSKIFHYSPIRLFAHWPSAAHTEMTLDVEIKMLIFQDFIVRGFFTTLT